MSIPSFKIILGDAIASQQCLVVGINSDCELTDRLSSIDDALGGVISQLIAGKVVNGELGQNMYVPLLAPLDDSSLKSILIIGTGKEQARTPARYADIIKCASTAIEQANLDHVTSYLSEVSVIGFDEPRKISFQVETFSFQRYHPSANRSSLQLNICASAVNHEGALQRGIAVAMGTTYCRQLADLPPNICTPTYLANEATRIAESHSKITAQVFDEEQISKIGMRTLLSVGAGSSEPSKFIVLEFLNSGDNSPPHVLLGKGITFDAGGVSIKSRAGMALMKYDMGGAAAVLGALITASKLELPINLVVAIACAENMPGGKAAKPTDVVRSMSGKTIEILNTDAEGRLVLCDALSYVERYKPASVVDVATLTGASLVALGRHYATMLCNDQSLGDRLLNAGLTANDRAWQLPLSQEDLSQLDSDFADISNMGDGSAAAIVAALFLSEFAKEYPWAHLDISSVAKVSSPKVISTGRPVPLLAQYLIDLCVQ